MARRFAAPMRSGLIDSARVWQIGLRGTGYTAEDFNEARGWGFQVVQAEEVWHKSLAAAGRCGSGRQIGAGPVYISYDIDSLDPALRRAPARPKLPG